MTTTITRLDSELPHPSTSHYDAFDTRSFLSQPKTILSPETVDITPLPVIQHQQHFHQDLQKCLGKHKLD